LDTIILSKPLTLKEAATFTGYSPAYIYKLVHQKKIPCYKPEGGRVLFDPEDLKAFVYRGRQAADYELAAQADAILMAGGKK